MMTSENLKARRLALRMTQDELGAALKRTRHTIMRWESGDTIPHWVARELAWIELDAAAKESA